MITAYLYKSCTSCRQAEALLRELDANFEVREHFKQKLTVKELKTLMKQTGLSMSDILSTRSTPYKEQGLAEKNLSDGEILEMMSEEPRLIKRPILVSGKDAVVGYNQAAIRQLVAKDSAA